MEKENLNFFQLFFIRVIVVICLVTFLSYIYFLIKIEIEVFESLEVYLNKVNNWTEQLDGLDTTNFLLDLCKTSNKWNLDIKTYTLNITERDFININNNRPGLGQL